MAEGFRTLVLKSGGPWFKSSTLLLSGFVLGSPEFNSSTRCVNYLAISSLTLQTTTATEMRTSPNKRFNEQKNSCPAGAVNSSC